MPIILATYPLVVSIGFQTGLLLFFIGAVTELPHDIWLAFHPPTA